jgi:aerobic carbon-monoxide dehydrogenase medium subunit
MPSVVEYHRPTNLDEALRLLSQPNTRALGGGTVVVPEARVHRDVGMSLVDLQDLGLEGITVAGTQLTVGSMVRLGDLMIDGRVPELIRDLARRELPSTLRNQATVGGTIALGSGDSVLLAGLLVHGAVVTLRQSGTQVPEDKPLAQSLSDCVGQGIVVSVTIETTGRGAIEGTGRTPADVPIVAAIARRSAEGVRVALTGVGPSPIEVLADDPTAGLEPPSDFRGTGDYRLHLAGVLTERAAASIQGAS